MGPEQIATGLGIEFPSLEPGYLSLCARSGDLLITSGHTSDITGMLGRDLDLDDGYAAARECGVKILQSVHDRHGTLDGLRVVKVLGCVRSHPDFDRQPAVVNGASDLLHEVFPGDLGHHARSALGLAALPNGAAVEVEAIFEIVR